MREETQRGADREDVGSVGSTNPAFGGTPPSRRLTRQADLALRRRLDRPTTLSGMRTYLRTRAPGGLYFFTLVLANRREDAFLVRRIEALRQAFRQTRAERPFAVEAIVVLPDHLHCLWRLPEGDADYPTRWRLIKSRFSRATAPTEALSESRKCKGERGIWQRRYWEHLVRDEEDFWRHLDYIHFNPVKHGYAESAGQWPHSSFQRWVARGAYRGDWGRADT